eukprot:snap_masked-scaffold_88-processed-gene-0.37-mRNA-1 protein AED:1.00 eAED:1.00 QI:0/-1/0/0/-1/1/1/0/126
MDTEVDQARGKAQDFWSRNRIQTRFSATKMPKLNGISEHVNRTASTGIRTFSEDSKLERKHWIRTSKRAVYLLNILPVYRASISPHEIIYGKKKTSSTNTSPVKRLAILIGNRLQKYLQQQKKLYI